MKKTGLAVTAAAAAVFSALSVAQSSQPACTGPAYHSFDFWIGEWNIHGPKGKLLGVNSIKREIGDCVLHERYENGKGYSGESFNIYDASTNRWHQTWVDSGGSLLILNGGFKDGKMILEGETTDVDGKITKHKITWTPLTDGGLRQVWESVDSLGKVTIAYDGQYRRK